MWRQRTTTSLTSASGDPAGHVDLETLLPALTGSGGQGAARFVVEVGATAVQLCEDSDDTVGATLPAGGVYEVGGERGFTWPGGLPWLYLPTGATAKVTAYTAGRP